MTEYSVEEVRYIANKQRATMPYLAATLDAYADLREQIERAREGVTDEVVKIAANAFDEVVDNNNCHSTEEPMLAALLAVAHLLPSGERKDGDATKGRIDFKGMWDAMSDQATVSQPAQAAQVDAFRRGYDQAKLEESINADLQATPTAEPMAQLSPLAAFVRSPVAERARIGQQVAARVDEMLAEPVAQGEAVACWRYRNWLGEVVSEWIDGQPPEKLFDPCGNELVGCAIEVAYAAQPASPEQPAERQGEVACPECGAPCVREERGLDSGDVIVSHTYTHPAAPVGVPDAWPKLELWFFRELVEAQRLKLFALHGMPVDEIGASHIHQKRALRQLFRLPLALRQSIQSHLQGAGDEA